METRNFLGLITLLLVLNILRVSSLSSPFSPIIIQAKYEQNYQKITNASIEYVFLYPASNVIIYETNYTYILFYR